MRQTADFRRPRTKLSNNHTNKLRNFNKDVKAAARFSGRTITENGITRIYDVAGNLVKQFCRPEKRPLSELLGNRLAAIAKPKRDKTRTTSGPTSGNSSNSESPVGAAGGFLTPIQEEDENVVAASQGQEEGHLDEASEKNENAGEAFHVTNRLSTPSCNAVNSHFNSQYPPPDRIYYSTDSLTFPTSTPRPTSIHHSMSKLTAAISILHPTRLSCSTNNLTSTSRIIRPASICHSAKVQPYGSVPDTRPQCLPRRSVRHQQSAPHGRPESTAGRTVCLLQPVSYH